MTEGRAPESKPAPARPWTARRMATAAAWPVAIVLAMPFAARSCGSCMGYEGVVMDQLNACPRATDLLGAPITEGYVGVSWGNASTGDDGGLARRRRRMMQMLSVTSPRAGRTYRATKLRKRPRHDARPKQAMTHDVEGGRRSCVGDGR